MKSTIVSLLGSAALVAAHGVVETGVIGGQTHTFYQPYQDPYRNPAPDRISRPVQGNGPVEDVNSIDIQCGGYTAGGIEGTQPAKLVANATAGEEVTLNWTLWPTSHYGPTITYMAKCPNNDCTSWQPGTEAVWFKIQEEGRIDTDVWGATALMTAGNSGVKYTIPECIAPGQYLVRHEIIALHSAAQFYPSCHQIEVSGSGSTTPSGLVAFPGAYKPTDPGMSYNRASATYIIPGPALFTCSGSGSGSGSPPAPAPSAATSSVISAAATVPTQTPQEEDDECPAESEPPVATPVPTQTPQEEDDECPAESEPPVATPVPTQTAQDEDDECPAESEPPVATPVPSQTAQDEDDECPAESEAPVATPTPTQPADEEDDDCPAEVPSATPVAKRMTLHERRLA
ncbi:Polysaccharide monooxygenase Cel61a [Colletotrichum tanaceti]|uniref:lytic cellulose monooxygenase (C4-dehydrogenating) n=1 Tax=Colletotrichum tanaceti TaxID=1306861 RepID=A0A4V6DHA2_9PEZI|nr:Polysaccharide monooxygenase Cel61a [Colletotrichum tanaceti]